MTVIQNLPVTIPSTEYPESPDVDLIQMMWIYMKHDEHGTNPLNISQMKRIQAGDYMKHLTQVLAIFTR